MTGVIEQVTLECTTGSSNKFYNVNIILDIDGIVTVGTWFGPIGKAGQRGVVGGFSFNAKECISNRTIDNSAAKIAAEANKLINSKIKKGYEVTGNKTSIDPVDLIKQLHSRFPAVVKEAAQQPKAPVDGAFEVEIISISASVIRVAKVRADYSYEVLGEAINPNRREVRTGDIVRVTKKGELLALI